MVHLVTVPIRRINSPLLPHRATALLIDHRQRARLQGSPQAPKRDNSNALSEAIFAFHLSSPTSTVGDEHVSIVATHWQPLRMVFPLALGLSKSYL